MKLFAEQELRGLTVLVPLLFVVVLLAILVDRTEPSRLMESDPAKAETTPTLRAFDPNVDDYEQLRQSGVPVEVAVGIVRWRNYGKVYRMPEDLAQVSGVTDSIYSLLKPYITIADSLAPRPRYQSSARGEVEGSERYSSGSSRVTSALRNAHSDEGARIVPEKFRIDTASASYLTRWGLSLRQAEVVVRYRDAIGGIGSEEQLRQCYVVSDEVVSRMLPYVIFSSDSESQGGGAESHIDDRKAVARSTPSGAPNYVQSRGANADPTQLLEINTADSAALVAIDGIGARSAEQIIRYRELLGGYHSVEQLSELKIITESNFEKILQQICCDSCKISKIDINFAGPKELERHPYISARALRRLVKQRQLKGGWSRIEDLIENDILSKDEAERLAPYLRFGL